MSEVKNILISGVNFQNQGAYMMLVAVAEQIRARGLGRPVIDIRWGTSRQKRAEGLSTLVAVDELGPLRSLMMERLPTKVRDRLPVLNYREIDAVIDASGFAFGDQWAHARLQARADRFAFFASRNIPVIIMPQAFGPFERTSSAAGTVVASASLLYARDPESLKYIKSISAPYGDKVKMATDFTIGLAAREPGLAARQYVDKVLIVPNVNIFSRGEGDKYIKTLKRLIESFLNSGKEVSGLVHDTGKDREIFSLLRDAGCSLPVLDGLDGLQSKWVIGESSAVVSGRFHATVSALSQGIPTIIHGWSHKYKHLAKDFEVGRLLASPYDADDSVRAYSEIVEDAAIRARLVGRKPALLKGVEKMWDEVESVINASGNGTVNK